MLVLENITKRFGPLTALDGVSLRIEAGEFFGLLGPNGAGKSTLMSLVAGLRAPDSGMIRLNGQRLSDANASGRAVLGLVPQHIALYPRLNAVQNLRIFGELYGLSGAILRDRIEEGLEAMHLADRRREPIENFSGGMQRRLNIIASLLHRPRLLLCDEPTVGVDPQSRNAIFEFLEKLNREGLAVIYSTHYMEEATRLCSRIGIIDHGKIHALGTLDELLLLLPFEEEIRFHVDDSPASQGASVSLSAPASQAASVSQAGAASLAETLRAHGSVEKREGFYCFRPQPGYRLSSFYLLTESLGYPARHFTIQRPSLEALFLHLTGTALRE